MAIIRVWEPATTPSAIYLRLVQNSNGVLVQACYGNGKPVEGGDLVTIGPGGLYQHRHVGSCGIRLDQRGSIAVCQSWSGAVLEEEYP